MTSTELAASRFTLHASRCSHTGPVNAMLLLLVRHANAGDRDPAQWPDDRDRPLTEKGRKVQAEVSRFLRKRDLAPTLVLTSPWIRARADRGDPGRGRPGDLAAGALRAAGRRPGSGPSSRTTSASNRPKRSSRWWDTRPGWRSSPRSCSAGSSNAIRIDFPKSGVMGIELERLEPQAGELRFFLRPKMV